MMCRIQISPPHFFPFQQYLQFKFKEQTILVFSKDKKIIYRKPEEETWGKENGTLNKRIQPEIFD